MKRTFLVPSLILLAASLNAEAQGNAFTYQGRLNDNGVPASGIYDLRFAIFDVVAGSSAIAGPVTNVAVSVSNGLFNTTLDFGPGVFSGGARWLEIGVRPNGSVSDFNALTPRQPITPAPYALFAPTAGTVPDGAITSSKLASGAAAANLQASGQSAVAGGGIVLSEQPNATELVNAGYIKLGRADLIEESWLTRSNGPPPFGPPAMARSDHAAVWTGSEMIVWGGYDGVPRNNGSRYNPSANSWVALSTNGPPAARYGHSAVWTGTEMIVFGGAVVGNFFTGGTISTNTGGRYNPATDTWTPITAGGGSRRNHVAFWTGSRMLVWGGTFTSTGTFGSGEAPRNDGALYDPVANNWTFISSTDAPSPRRGYSAIWTGTDLMVWGGYAIVGSFITTRTNFNDGARYNLAANTWTPMSLVGAPSRRSDHSAIWSGSQMIVWGGLYAETFGGSTNYNDGARYNPGANTWSALATSAATPTSRYGHTAAWLGNGMVVWGGTDGANLFNSGARYYPGANTWSNMVNAGRPAARSGHTVVTTASEMILWGGQNESMFLDIGGRYNLSTDIWQATPRTGDRSTRRGHTAIWTGSEFLVWGGFDGESYLDTGGRFNPALNSWAPITTNNAPTARMAHSAIWTGTEMIVWGGNNTNALNSGARYNPAADAWSATSTGTGTPTARNNHSAVWTGTQMIIWGGFDGSFRNTGGRYNPGANTWAGTTTASAPAARGGHAAVWTGTEMLVWGGIGGTIPSPVVFSNGGRYNPASNAWSPLPNTAAPAARTGHKGVWTGEELLVWGGSDLTTNLNSGGRYHSVSNTWSSITTNGAPSPRAEHTAVWAGTRLIIWGGVNENDYLRTGGVYNPLADAWSPTELSTNAPPARSQHVATWTGTEMIIHGGWNGGIYFDDSHQYVPPRTMFLYLKP